MKLKDFKLEKIRKEFVVELNGELQKVTIYNILNEEREEIRNEIEFIMGDKNELSAEEVEDVYNILFPACTNIEVDESTIDVLNNPNKDMVFILNEVKNILDEIYIEILLKQNRQLNEIEKGLLIKMNMLQAEKVGLLGKECTKIEKDIEEIKNSKEK